MSQSKNIGKAQSEEEREAREERLTPTSDSIASNKVQSIVVPTFSPAGVSAAADFTGVACTTLGGVAGLSVTTLSPRRTSFAINLFDNDDDVPPPPFAGEERLLGLTFPRLVASPKGALVRRL